MKKYLIIISFILCVISSCGEKNVVSPEVVITPDGDTTATVYTEGAEGIDYVLSVSDLNLDQEISYEDPDEIIDADDENFVENSGFSYNVQVVFSATSVATVSNLPEGVTASVSNNDVVITSTISSVKYTLSGSTADGMFKIYSKKKYELYLDGVSINNNDGPAFNLQSSKRVFMVLAENSKNVLSDASTYADAVNDEDQKGALFSEGSIIISGSGALSITGNYKHALACDEELIIRKGIDLDIISNVKDGIHTNDTVAICGGNIKITSVGDAVECEEGGITISGGSTNLATSGEKSHGLKSYGTIGISAGALKVTTTGDASKGISGDSDISITGGTIVAICKGDAIYDSDDNDATSSAGIKCDGNLIISDASYTAYSDGKGGKGINCDGTADFTNATIMIMTTGKKYTYSSSIDSSPKGIKVEGDLTINDGSDITIQTTGGEGSEALESKSTMTINGGTIQIVAYDDCINAANAIVINGGTIYCYSSNNDGIDSNGTISIAGGLIIASGTTSPEEGIDCDQNNFAITGGTLIGFGGATSTPTSSSCTQNSLIYGASGSANTLLSISSSDGTKNLLTCVIPRQYQQMTLLFSSPSLTLNSAYIISTGGSVSNGTLFHNYYTGGTYSGGTTVTTFTQSSKVTSVGSSSSGGGNPGGGGGRP